MRWELSLRSPRFLWWVGHGILAITLAYGRCCCILRLVDFSRNEHMLALGSVGFVCKVLIIVVGTKICSVWQWGVICLRNYSLRTIVPSKSFLPQDRSMFGLLATNILAPPYLFLFHNRDIHFPIIVMRKIEMRKQVWSPRSGYAG